MKVLIAVDGSEIAQASAARAGELLGNADAVTVLAVVTDLPGDDAGGIEGPTESPAEAEAHLLAEQTAAAEWIDAAISVLPDAWKPLATTRIEGGDAGPMITWVAEHEGSDVVVVGSHGHGFFKRLVMGSVSQHVVHHSPCPVLLVRADRLLARRHQVPGPLTREHGPRAFARDDRHARASGSRRTADVGQQHRARRGEQTRVHLGLALEHVDAGREDRALLERRRRAPPRRRPDRGRCSRAPRSAA